MLLFIMSYLVIGAFAGTLSGLLGIGGGSIIVPLLALVYRWQGFPGELIMHMAAGTSLAVMVATTLRALLLHRRHQTDFWPIYRKLMLGVMLGAFLGVCLAHFLASGVLSIILGVFLSLSGIKMLIAKSVKEGEMRLPRQSILTGVSLLIGMKSGLLGLGGGVLTVPFLSHYRVSIRQVIPVSLCVSVTVACVGSLAVLFTGSLAPGLPAWSTGYIYWPACLSVVCAGALCAPLGVYLSRRLPVQVLKQCFAVLLCLLGLHLLITP